MRILPLRPRESVRAGALHRLPDRWRLQRVHRRRPAILLRHSGDLQRYRSGTAALRGSDRLPLAAHGRRCAIGLASMASARPRISSRRWHDGRAATCSRSPALATPRRRNSRASWAPCGPVVPTSRRRRSLDAAIIFAPVGAAGAGRAARCRARRHSRLRRHPHEPDPKLSRTTSCGASASCAPSPT